MLAGQYEANRTPKGLCHLMILNSPALMEYATIKTLESTHPRRKCGHEGHTRSRFRQSIVDCAGFSVVRYPSILSGVQYAVHAVCTFSDMT